MTAVEAAGAAVFTTELANPRLGSDPNDPDGSKPSTYGVASTPDSPGGGTPPQESKSPADPVGDDSKSSDKASPASPPPETPEQIISPENGEESAPEGSAPRVPTSESASSRYAEEEAPLPVITGEPPRKRKTFLAEMKGIPEGIRHNPHILKRTNVFVPPATACIPRAALTKTDYQARPLPQLGPYAEAMFKQEQPEHEGTIDELRLASSQLREYQRESVVRGNYTDARAAWLGYKRVNRDLRSRTSFDKSKDQVNDMISKRNELFALVQSTNDEWDALIADHAAQTKQVLTEIDERHQGELAEFDQDIPDELPPLFRRNSVTYLELRSKERNLANTTHFCEARRLQAEADAMAKREREANFETLDMFYRRRRQRLQNHHETVFQSWGEYATRIQTHLIHQREKSVEGHRNRVDGLDKQIVLKCEQKGIKQGQINLELVNEERIALVKQKEDENPVTYKRCATAMIETRQSYPSVTEPRSKSRTAPVTRPRKGKLSPLAPAETAAAAEPEEGVVVDDALAPGAEDLAAAIGTQTPEAT
jgi:hypothetical protein